MHSVTFAPVQVKRYAFSGGQDTLEKQREMGANTDIDVPYQYLNFFMEDDAELARVSNKVKHVLPRYS